MKKHITIILVLGSVLSTLIISSLPIPVLAKDIKEEISVKPIKTLSPEEQAVLSSSASKVLRHIAQAREDIHKKDLNSAANELKQAHKLIDIIKASMPMVKVKDHIWVAKKHLSYENTEEVLPDLIPIYASLDEIEKTIPVDKARAHIDKAKKHLEKGNKEGAQEELKLADEALIYTEIDLPLKSTEKHINAAQDYLDKKDSEKADKALKAAEDGVRFISIYGYSPLARAKKSLWKATKNYAAGEMDAAKRELKKAKAYVQKALQSSEGKSKTEAEKLLKEIEALGIRVENKTEEAGSLFKGLWERAQALTEYSAEHFVIFGETTAVSDLIDAKLHTAYAESYYLTEGEKDKALEEIGKADSYLSKAMKLVNETVKLRLYNMEKELEQVKSDTASSKKDDAVKERFEDIKFELADIIYTY
jgi:hypothetical protein